MESLTGIIAFVHTAEHLSFVAAGRVLGISASAVGKSVAKLEESVGTRLLNRTTRCVALTEDGARFYERCRRILDDLQDAQTMLSASGRCARGRLRVSVPTIGYRFLLPVIPDFRALYPEIELDIDFSDRHVEVIEEGFDAVIRSGELKDSTLMSRRLGPFYFLLCASPDYLERNGYPQIPEDLGKHLCLRFRVPASGKLQAWQLANYEGAIPLADPSPLTFNNMEAVRAAALAGLGIAYMPDFLARDALASGSLRTVLDGHTAASGKFSIVWPPSRQLLLKLRVFIDFVSDRLFTV